MDKIKDLLIWLVMVIIGTSAGFFICKQTYLPQVAALKDKISSTEKELEKTREELKISKDNVRLVFTHNEKCTIENVQSGVDNAPGVNNR